LGEYSAFADLYVIGSSKDRTKEWKIRAPVISIVAYPNLNPTNRLANTETLKEAKAFD